MKILWYWPHPHRIETELARFVTRPADSLTVQCLDSFDGQSLPRDFHSYTVRRELPDVNRNLKNPLSRTIDRLRVYLTRARRRDRLVRSNHFDVIHIQTVVSLVDAFMIGSLSRQLPVVVLVHDVTPHQRRWYYSLECKALGMIYKNASRLMVFHETIRARLVQEFSVSEDKIDVVPHPLMLPLIPDSEIRKVTQSPPTILFFGAIRKNKGLSFLLDAVKHVDPTLVRFVIAGGGDGDLERAVMDTAARFPNVTPEIGIVSDLRRDQLLRSADLIVLPYTSEYGSQSGVLFNAYSYGVPLIATDVGAIGPTIRADGSGWVVNPADSKALANAILDAAQDLEKRRKAIENILKNRKRYENSSVAARYRESYQKAADSWQALRQKTNAG